MRDVMTDRVTAAEFAALSDYKKGFVSYVQAMWPNSEVPDDVPPGADPREWQRGRDAAIRMVQDMEE